MDYIISILPQMWLGTIETLKLFFITIVLSIPLGILLALARVSSLGSLRSAVGVYVWLLRGTPLMLQLLFVYYGLPFIPGIGIRMDDFQAAIFAFVLIMPLISAKFSAPVSRLFLKASMKRPVLWA